MVVFALIADDSHDDYRRWIICPMATETLYLDASPVPPGYTREATVNFAQSMEDVARPLWENPNPEKLPHIDRFFFVAYNGGTLLVLRRRPQETRIRELIPVLSEPVAKRQEPEPL